LEPVAIPVLILNEVYAHARESLPEECCGLIIGSTDQPYRRAVRCRNDMTLHHRRDPKRFPRDGREGFFMNEQDYLRALHEAEEEGAAVTAVYHSHVDCGAYFSEMDQDFATQPLYPFPRAEHLVVAMSGGKIIDQNLFRREEPNGQFVGRKVISRPADADEAETRREGTR
jgi:proteasome lid subunit RPN8/RPN11